MYERTTLPNGLRVLSSTMPHVRSVSTGIFVGAGSRYEDDSVAGASHFLEHMLFKGTAKRPEPQMISRAIESVGGIMNASTDREATLYYTKVARDHFAIALDVLADMYNAPLFQPDEIERERGVILEELAMTYDHPDSLADMLIDKALWPDQAMGRDVGGTRESVGGITREQLAAYHAQQYVPANTVVAVAGNVEHHEVVESVAALLGNGQAAGETLAMHPVEPDEDQGVRVEVVNRKTDQAHLCLAVDGPAANSDDRYAVDLLNTVLGEGMSSRLFVELRERRGLAYDVHSSAMHYRDCGALLVTCGVDTANATEAIKAVLREWDGVQQGVTEEELSRAVEYAVGRLGLRLEDTRAVMGWMGGQELLRNHVRTPEEVVANIRGVTPEQVTEAARRYFGPAVYRFSAVGPFRSQARFEKLLAA
ncbi:MAG: pitrilysin family protein [Chloroflexota bacterium]|nr:pitrilysin family protein [Chloroflexota bacterium]MDE2886328.1 pitrilysin family protein [Chloroflexota bacterium]